ncbi:ATP-binding protein [Streptomyces sp. SID3343]|uniref:ATP-binding protein n=1 Tax=Streptomyces sp. SID3343 TaxID=2690260 RepID=UPI0023512D0E|nr:ATP-binding protein [Streptomyces sp. SID3343]
MRSAERARAESWTHAEFPVVCLESEIATREYHGGEARIRSARFPVIKTIKELDTGQLVGMTRKQLAHLGTLDFIVGKENIVFLRPPGTGKTHLAVGLAVSACQAGHRVAFATAAEWVDRLAAAHHTGCLQAELTRLSRYPLIVVDEVGYIPFEAEAANLFFQLVSNRYERASGSSRATSPSEKRTCSGESVRSAAEYQPVRLGNSSRDQSSVKERQTAVDSSTTWSWVKQSACLVATSVPQLPQTTLGPSRPLGPWQHALNRSQPECNSVPTTSSG